ncbi:hypothetical protein [Streptomyces noursei]|uniref:hypothetical protein n=1 Tax=Streptomyces noursei TaxID=1971 RepID=UPI0030EFD01A
MPIDGRFGADTMPDVSRKIVGVPGRATMNPASLSIEQVVADFGINLASLGEVAAPVAIDSSVRPGTSRSEAAKKRRHQLMSLSVKQIPLQVRTLGALHAGDLGRCLH